MQAVRNVFASGHVRETSTSSPSSRSLAGVAIRPVVIYLPPEPAAGLVAAAGLGAGDRLRDQLQGRAAHRAQVPERAARVLAPLDGSHPVAKSSGICVTKKVTSAARAVRPHDTPIGALDARLNARIALRGIRPTPARPRSDAGRTSSREEVSPRIGRRLHWRRRSPPGRRPRAKCRARSPDDACEAPVS
jgi:hypothetical protein